MAMADGYAQSSGNLAVLNLKDNRSADVGAQLKLTASEVERALAAVGTGAANTVLTSAREVQTTLVAASGDVASQIKSLSADVERTLSAAGSATASKQAAMLTASPTWESTSAANAPATSLT